MTRALLEKSLSAFDVLMKLDARRKLILPYFVRDPVHEVQKELRAELAKPDPIKPALQGTDVDCAQHLKDGGADLASKLLPCPFCGETPEMYYQMDDLDDWKVLCHCGACTCPDEIRRTEKRAMEDWNTRTAPAWHDAPTEAGLWMNSISGRVNVVIEETLSAWQDTGARWFGPLPEDKP